MYVAGEQQQKEIATIKPRTITLKLSDADCERIAKDAGKAGLMKYIQIMSSSEKKPQSKEDAISGVIAWRDELKKLKGEAT